MKYIKLTRGEFAMVDDEDFERVNQFKWCVHTDPKRTDTKYAIRSDRSSGRRVTVSMHRFILPHDFPETDHKNGNGLDNQKQNLRPCTTMKNGQNRKLQKHSSKFKGVHFLKRENSWTSSIRVGTKKIHLGSFSSEVDAANAYDLAALRYFGNFARTNQMEGVGL